MPRERVTIAGSGLEPFEIAAQVLAVLIHPDDTKARQRFADATCYCFLRDRAGRDKTWAAEPQSIRPRYLLVDEHNAEMEWERGKRLLYEERLLAGAMLLPFIKQWMEQPRKLHLREDGVDIGPLRLATVTDWAARIQAKHRGKPDIDIDTPKTVEQRAWKHSKPVLHVAACMAAIVAREEARGNLSVGDFLNSPGLIEELLYTAEPTRLILPDIAERSRPKLKGLGEAETIRVALQ